MKFGVILDVEASRAILQAEVGAADAPPEEIGLIAALLAIPHGGRYPIPVFGSRPYSQPQIKSFDEFYGIPPGDTWGAFLLIPQARQIPEWSLRRLQ